MENFPPLQGDQVALLRAKVETGNVLDENYNYKRFSKGLYNIRKCKNSFTYCTGNYRRG